MAQFCILGTLPFQPSPYSVILSSQSPEMQVQSKTSCGLYVGPDQGYYVSIHHLLVNQLPIIAFLFECWKQLLKWQIYVCLLCRNIGQFCSPIMLFTFPLFSLSCSRLSFFPTRACLLRIVRILLAGLFLLVQRRPWWLHGFGPGPLLGNCWFCISQFYTVKYVVGRQCMAITINVPFSLNLYHAQNMLNSVYITSSIIICLI